MYYYMWSIKYLTSDVLEVYFVALYVSHFYKYCMAA